MSKFFGAKRPILVALILVLAGPALPAFGQDTSAEARLRRIEAEVRALQTKVFPGGDGKFFAPQIAPGQAAPATGGAAPATTPVTDLLTRMDSVEATIARLTAQGEVNANKLAQLEARLDVLAPVATIAPTPAVTPTPTPTPAATTPAPRPTATPTPTRPTTATAPSAARLAAVRAVVKPQTTDAGDDEYSYGFRLWEGKFYPEAQQQLKLFLERYPRHSRLSYARNLLGRAYLDDGKPRDAAQWFLQNYQAGKTGERAPDSLLLLAESMSRLKDTSRACIALAEFADTYPAEAVGRLLSQYNATRAAVKCN
ncbi:MAG TPA: tetratricopeptide repeat protein [Novosphingobium sp.]|nr:tetratricopeptide repeat protein [Novosphingobium sp.]